MSGKIEQEEGAGSGTASGRKEHTTRKEEDRYYESIEHQKKKREWKEKKA
jgi:hypothetical protein